MNMKKQIEKLSKDTSMVNLLKRSTRAWAKGKPGFSKGSRGTNWMGKTGQKSIPGDPTGVRKRLIRRQNRWSLLPERNWKIKYMRKLEHLPLVIT